MEKLNSKPDTEEELVDIDLEKLHKPWFSNNKTPKYERKVKRYEG